MSWPFRRPPVPVRPEQPKPSVEKTVFDLFRHYDTVRDYFVSKSTFNRQMDDVKQKFWENMQAVKDLRNEKEGAVENYARTSLALKNAIDKLECDVVLYHTGA